MEGVEPGFHYSGESFKDPQDLTSKAECRTNLQEVLGCFYGSTPNVEQALGLTLGIVGEGILQEWFQSCHDSFWSNTVVLDQIKHLYLIPRQQAQLLSGEVNIYILFLNIYYSPHSQLPSKSWKTGAGD